jgi:hypothetical protein
LLHFTGSRHYSSDSPFKINRNSSGRLATCGGSPIFVVDKAASSRLVHNKKVCEAPQALSSIE